MKKDEELSKLTLYGVLLLWAFIFVCIVASLVTVEYADESPFFDVDVIVPTWVEIGFSSLAQIVVLTVIIASVGLMLIGAKPKN